MYLLSKELYINHMLPPHWRSTWKEAMLSALLAPLFSIYRRFILYRRAMVETINMSAQILVLDSAVKRISGSSLSNVTDRNDGSFAVLIPDNSNQQVISQVREIIKKYRPAGVKYDIQLIEGYEKEKSNKE